MFEGILFHWLIVLGKKDRQWEDVLQTIGRNECSCVFRDLVNAGRRRFEQLTSTRPWTILYIRTRRASMRLSSRERHQSSFSISVTLASGWKRARVHLAALRWIISTLYEPLFSTPHLGSQTLQQYSSWGRTRLTYAFCLSSRFFTLLFLFRNPKVPFFFGSNFADVRVPL